MRFYKILWKLTKAMIFHDIFLVKSLTLVLFRSIAKYYWHFMISYHDKQNFSVCYWPISPLGDIGKYFTIIKQKEIFPISQVPNLQTCCDQFRGRGPYHESFTKKELIFIVSKRQNGLAMVFTGNTNWREGSVQLIS